MEIRINEVVLAGRLVGRFVKLSDETVHFRLEATEAHDVFHCFCDGATAENLLKFCSAGDEISIEGELAYRHFSNQAQPVLLIKARFISYGRKNRTLRLPGTGT